MPVIRVSKTRDFTVMSNHHLRNKSLSLKAKGLMSQLLSFPNNWEYSIAGLSALSKDGKDAVRSGIEELEDAGYVVRTQAHDDEGRFCGYDYTIYEIPQNNTAPAPADSPSSEKPTTGCTMTENPTETSTHCEGKTYSSTTKPKKGASEARSRYGQYENVLLSDGDYRTLQEEFPADWAVRIERLSEYIACSGKSYKNHLAVIRRWARTDRQRAQEAKASKKPDYSFDECEVL
ncbi:helix-turn-helix domain-containing protein [Adlercreutzia sp. ZJ473]|uniref:helix-turn-helix domain-containing protein n=1 Tax=Adlercreutzia sp. ZJ473 TaxID=2722822 RepID=UPI001553F285|nr:helix-turn-helix domain-containing protein [Adlercreutzia sp. ZJ473]